MAIACGMGGYIQFVIFKRLLIKQPTIYSQSGQPAQCRRRRCHLRQCCKRRDEQAHHNDSVHADEKLGTKWGDEIDDSVTSIEAKRLSDEPIGEIAISYAGKEFQGSAVKSISLLTGQVQLSILDDQYNPLPAYRLDGNYYLKAKENQSYYLHYRNSSSNTYEIIASVDGINVLTGNAASKYSPTGYILDARGELTIKGFRKDEHSVASFTFSKPENSYANHSAQGDIGNVGIIGTVVYELQMPKQNPKPSFASPPTNKPKAFPTDK